MAKLSASDLAFLASRGIHEEEARRQLDLLETPPPHAALDRPSRPWRRHLAARRPQHGSMARGWRQGRTKRPFAPLPVPHREPRRGCFETSSRTCMSTWSPMLTATRRQSCDATASSGPISRSGHSLRRPSTPLASSRARSTRPRGRAPVCGSCLSVTLRATVSH